MREHLGPSVLQRGKRKEEEEEIGKTSRQGDISAIVCPRSLQCQCPTGAAVSSEHAVGGGGGGAPSDLAVT